MSKAKPPVDTDQAPPPVDTGQALVLCDIYFHGEKVPAGTVATLTRQQLNADFDPHPNAVEYALANGAPQIDLTVDESVAEEADDTQPASQE